MAEDRSPDVFISYAREDLRRAQVLAQALEDLGWLVFFDRTIPPGSSWRESIGRALDEATCIVVGWSQISVDSDWVIEEAEEQLLTTPVIGLSATADAAIASSGCRSVSRSRTIRENAAS